MNQDLSKAKCGECEAVCPGDVGTVSGTKVCNRAIDEPLLFDGKCEPEIRIPCVKTCPVDCIVQTPDPKNYICSADCKKPTKTVEMAYTTIRDPLNSGKPCPPGSVFGTKTCSLSPSEVAANCGSDCLVAGRPRNECSRKCKATPEFFGKVTATYPITLRTAARGARSCPTRTLGCDCKDCSLGLFPTQVGPCNAICTAFDDSYAFGSQAYVYPVETPAKQGGKCDPVEIETCSRKCPCEYTTSSVQKCAFTKTLKHHTPWLAKGKALATMYGPSCTTTTYKSCASKLHPTNCVYRKDCPECKCTPTIGPDYLLSKSVSCTNHVFSQADNGGLQCPKRDQHVCSKRCPGCLYQSQTCGCSITGAKTNADNVVYSGLKTCTNPPVRETNKNCPTSTTRLSDACSTTIRKNECFLTQKQCGSCSYTKFFQSENTQYGAGERTCTVEDYRHDAPSTCSPTIQTAQCTEPGSPIDCKNEKICLKCKAKCEPHATTIATGKAKCTSYQVQSAMFGGKECLPLHEDVVCKKQCKPKTLPDIDSLLNGFIFGDAKGLSSFVGGRLVVCGNATLIDYVVGSELRDKVEGCLEPALRVGGGLLMMGSVYGGPVIVDSKCSKEIDSQCPISCNMECEKLNCKQRFQQIQKYSLFLKSQTPNSKVEQDDELLLITWTPAEIVSLHIPASNMFLPLRYSGSLDAKEIQITVLGKQISFARISLEYFKDKNVVWNFPEALNLQIDVTIYGKLIAPNARVSGSGVIKGRLFAKELDSISLKLY